jgi:hypothetical protein
VAGVGVRVAAHRSALVSSRESHVDLRTFTRQLLAFTYSFELAALTNEE